MGPRRPAPARRPTPRRRPSRHRRPHRPPRRPRRPRQGPARRRASTPRPALQAEAVETVKKFYAAWNDALVTHDSRPLTALALPECESCALIAADIDTIAKKRLRVVGGQITLSRVRADPGVDQGIPVQGELVRAAIQLIDASGKVTRSAEEDTAPGMLWILERRDGVLKIREINR